MRLRLPKIVRDHPDASAAVAAGVGAVVLVAGAYAVVSAFGRRRPAVKIPLPPRANGMPSPDPITPEKVPPTVTTAATTMAPAAPPPSTTVPSEIDYQGKDWMTYGWYTYKGNAPEKMWIRVDINRDNRFQPYVTSSSFRTEKYLPGTWRWTVVMGDQGIPMALGVYDNQIEIVCEDGDPCFEDMKNMPIYSPGGVAPAQAAFDARVRREWTDPSAALLVARAAADWIDVAYGGS